MCKILPRLKDIAANEGITIGAFERKIGASKGVISRAIANGTDIQSKWIEAVVEKYPHYSAQWLLTGEGNMLRHEVTEDFDGQGDFQSYDCATETRPRIPFEAAAGSLSIAIGSVHKNDCEHIPVIPTFPRYDFTIIARGDSMFPDFQSGDELACAFVHETSFIQWGRVHVLDTAQGVVVKRIFDTPNSILCKSINKEYPDFEIPKDEVFHIAIVIGLIRHF